MQTFLPFPDFVKSAKVLDSKRLGKQRVETSQILQINLAVTNPDDYYVCSYCCKLISKENVEKPCPKCYGKKREPLVFLRAVGYKIPWENHPAVLMWRGYEFSLASYGISICREWQERGFNDSLLSFFYPIVDELYGKYFFMQEKLNTPDWIAGNTLTSNSKFCCQDYCQYDAGHTCSFCDRYTNTLAYRFHLSHQSNLLRKFPEHYSQYFPGVPNNLPYVWPSKENK